VFHFLVMIKITSLTFWGACLAGAGSLLAQTNPVTPASERAAVKVTAAQQANVGRYLLLTGELRAEKEASVAANASGKVAHVYIERGSAVATGDLLVQLDDKSSRLSVREAEANVASAKASTEHARNDYERNEPLARTKAIAQSEFQKYKADYEARVADLQVAEARLDMARQNLSDLSIRAPFDAGVSERLVQVGEYVQPSTAVGRLVTTKHLLLELNVPETSVGGIRCGQAISFSVAAYPNHAFAAKLNRISSALQRSGRDLVVEGEVDNSDLQLRPGMFASAKLYLKTVPGTVVPPEALRAEGSSYKVFVVENAQACEKLVEVGETGDGWVEIRRGLNPGEKVILSPVATLKDGSPVQL
jgi:membrane fusion protein, multidrug efflux system